MAETKGRRALGVLGEEKACDFLRAKGHRIVSRNWRGSHLEVDIISEDAAGLHFVEVKTRLAPAGTAPEEKVDGRKRQRIGAAALKFLNQSGSDREVFFDVVTVLFDGDRTELSYFPQAWIPMYV
ncbi:MAG: YraN family protein [Bacteroidales bacterium]|nr:YraN family protein [Bacteroidales bacterium]